MQDEIFTSLGVTPTPQGHYLDALMSSTGAAMSKFSEFYPSSKSPLDLAPLLAPLPPAPNHYIFFYVNTQKIKVKCPLVDLVLCPLPLSNRVLCPLSPILGLFISSPNPEGGPIRIAISKMSYLGFLKQLVFECSFSLIPLYVYQHNHHCECQFDHIYS